MVDRAIWEIAICHLGKKLNELTVSINNVKNAVSHWQWFTMVKSVEKHRQALLDLITIYGSMEQHRKVRF